LKAIRTQQTAAPTLAAPPGERKDRKTAQGKEATPVATRRHFLIAFSKYLFISIITTPP
jgi:hypothetical protein